MIAEAPREEALVEVLTVKQKLWNLIDQTLDEADIVSDITKPLIRRLLKKAFDKAADDQIEKGIITLRNQIIPWLLDGHNQE